MIIRTTLSVATALALAWSAPAFARATAQEVERLGKDLTPVGAEKAANKEGTIPAWDGGLTKAPAGFDAKKGYADPYAATSRSSRSPRRTPRSTPTSSRRPGRAAEEASRLQDQRLSDAPQRRASARVYEDIRKNAGRRRAHLGRQRRRWIGHEHDPVPVPEGGRGPLWNHSFRWRGGSVERESSWYVVQPSGANFRVRTTDRFVFENAGYLDTKRDNMNFVWMGYYRLPATLEGTILLVHDTIDQGKEARSGWLYNAGPAPRAPRAGSVLRLQRDGTEGLRFTDQYDAWNGTTGPLHVEARRQEGDVHPVQRLQALRQVAQGRGRPQARHREPGAASLRAAPRVGGRGHAEGRQAPRLREARRCTSTRTRSSSPPRISTTRADSSGGSRRPTRCSTTT
jgi:hypothetical protein